MLQVLPDAMKDTSILVSSHYKDAANIFIPFGINVIKYEEFMLNKSPEEVAEGYNIETAKRTFFLPQSIITPLASTNNALAKLSKVEKPLIGIHPVGSVFANRYWFQRGQPIKYMPKKFLKDLTSDDRFHYLLFGTNDEIDEFEDILEENITPISCDHIWDSFAFVDFCDLVIGVDSAIKSYSSMRKIPTLCFVGDYPDEMRDTLFLTPYVVQGVMGVVKFRTMEENELKEAKKWIDNSIKSSQ